MKKMAKIGAVLGLAMMSSVAMAADAQWEIFTGGMASIDWITAGTTTTNINVWGATAQRFAPSVGYNLGGGWELLVTPSFLSSAAATTTTTWAIQAGVAYNFMGAWDDSMFVGAQAGIAGTSAATSSSNFVWNVMAGKRFKIVDHVTYAPALAFTSASTTPASTTFSIIPFQLTVQM